MANNPYQVVRRHFERGSIAATYNALNQRMIEIGAQDLEEAAPEPAKTPARSRMIRRRPRQPAGTDA